MAKFKPKDAPTQNLITPPMDPTQDKMARAFYGALTLASSNGCPCQPCQVLRVMHKKLMGDLSSSLLKDLEEE